MAPQSRRRRRAACARTGEEFGRPIGRLRLMQNLVVRKEDAMATGQGTGHMKMKKLIG